MPGLMAASGGARARKGIALTRLANSGVWALCLLLLYGWLSGRLVYQPVHGGGEGEAVHPPANRRALQDGAQPGTRRQQMQGQQPQEQQKGGGSAVLAADGAQAAGGTAAANSQQQQQHQLGVGEARREKPRILVIYIFSNTDPEYLENLRFFIKFGMQPDDGCDYLIVVQGNEGDNLPQLPTLPANARYLNHPNRCYDWGTIGWVLSSKQVDPAAYRYFIFMNSSVRGPFIPPYAQNQTRWQDLMVGKLSESVRLVGPTISCEGSPYKGDVQGEWRSNPHVQSYVLATDRAGLDIWLADKNVFACWDSMWDVIWHGELGSSLAILNAGFNLDSFVMRYQGVDWRDKANWGCNGKSNPYGEHYLDGVSLNPFEVLFVKVKERVLQNEWSFAVQAKKYTEWMRQQAEGKPEIASNVYKTEPRRINFPRLAYMLQRGPECFDWHYYLAKNEDLRQRPEMQSKDALWAHFLRVGAYEGRHYRFTCEPQL